MCVHFILSGIARVYNIYCIYVYSVIDPSWALSFRFRYLLVILWFWCAGCLCDGDLREANCLRYFFPRFCFIQYTLFLLLSILCWSFHWFWFYTPPALGSVILWYYFCRLVVDCWDMILSWPIARLYSVDCSDVWVQTVLLLYLYEFGILVCVHRVAGTWIWYS